MQKDHVECDTHQRPSHFLPSVSFFKVVSWIISYCIKPHTKIIDHLSFLARGVHGSIVMGVRPIAERFKPRCSRLTWCCVLFTNNAQNNYTLIRYKKTQDIKLFHLIINNFITPKNWMIIFTILNTYEIKNMQHNFCTWQRISNNLFHL